MAISQHKSMAMGQSIGHVAPASSNTYAKGGRVGGVMSAIKGQPMSPIQKAKMNNGVPGFKKGGPMKKGCK